MTRRILVPLDGSVTAEAVLPYAASLARATDASLLLLRIVTPGEVSQSLFWKTTIPAELRREWTEEALTRANVYLTSVAERLRARDLHVVFDVQPADDAATAIVSRAEHEPDVRLSCNDNPRLRRRSALGIRQRCGKGVACHTDAVCSSCAQTEENTPAVTEVPYRTICVPLDGSPLAEQALATAQPIAARIGATLLLVCVVTGDDIAEAREYLEGVAERLRADRFNVQTHVVEGIPADQIISVAQTGHADLIVMATHGRTGLRQIWLGSVATKVVHSSELPVLLVRAYQEED
jgi:nucleotide-binding universal stress UspA family protein